MFDPALPVGRTGPQPWPRGMEVAICVFCGSVTGRDDRYVKAAEELAHALVARNMGLVYGGASTGLMGAVADAVLARSGTAVGVIPQALADREVAHLTVSPLYVVQTMHQRKAFMAKLSDGFIALPGGLGTLEELAEVWTWGQLGLHRKPCGLLNVAGYYDPLIACIDHMAAEGFLAAPYRDMILVAANPEDLLDQLAAYQPPPVKWLETQPGGIGQSTEPQVPEGGLAASCLTAGTEEPETELPAGRMYAGEPVMRLCRWDGDGARAHHTAGEKWGWP